MSITLTLDVEYGDMPMEQDPLRNLNSILKAAADYGVKLSCFIEGRWAAGNPYALADVRDAGHGVANHTYYHAPMDSLAEPWVGLDRTRSSLLAAGLDDHQVFRAPYGRLAGDLKGKLTVRGWKHVRWDHSPHDWERLTHATWIERMRSYKEGVILLHSWSDSTAYGLGLYLKEATESGKTFTHLTALDNQRV